MSFKSVTNAGVAEFYDTSTGELLDRLSAIKYREDFIGAGNLVIPAAGSAESGMDWVKKIVGAAPPTVAGVANTQKIRCALTATSQKQDAVLYFGDQLNFDMTKKLMFETHSNVVVLPSAASVQAILGLQSAWIDGPDNATYYAQFCLTASGLVLLRTKDGVNTKSVSSGVTLTADTWHLFRIDATDVTDVKFYIDGVQYGQGNSLAFAATGSNAVLQPYFGVYKPSGTGVATLDVGSCKVFHDRA